MTRIITPLALTLAAFAAVVLGARLLVLALGEGGSRPEQRPRTAVGPAPSASVF